MERQGRALSQDEVSTVVQRAIAGDDCLDRLACRAIFGNPRGPRHSYGEYSDAAKESWNACLALYDLLRPDQVAPIKNKKRKANNRKLPLHEAWAALLFALAPKGKERSPGESFSWATVGEVLGLGARAAQYQLLRRIGFKMGKAGERKVIKAGPCLQCKRVTSYKTLKELKCARCREGSPHS